MESVRTDAHQEQKGWESYDIIIVVPDNKAPIDLEGVVSRCSFEIYNNPPQGRRQSRSLWH